MAVFTASTIAGGTGLNSQGTVFKITPSGVLTTLFNFAEESGARPALRRFADQFGREVMDGFLYGTTPPRWRQRAGNRIQG